MSHVQLSSPHDSLSPSSSSHPGVPSLSPVLQNCVMEFLVVTCPVTMGDAFATELKNMKRSILILSNSQLWSCFSIQETIN